MLPSVRAQKPVVAGPSWASVDATLTAMMGENALLVDLIRAGYRRLPGKAVNRSTIALPTMPDFLTRRPFVKVVR
jgi:hypothetical protein